MEDLLKKATLSEFTKKEFAVLLEEIIAAEGGEKYQDKLINHFEKVVPHPDGMDLIFFVPDEDATPKAIIEKIDAWCLENSLPSFKE